MAGMFSLADQGALERIVQRAGFSQVRVEPLSFVAVVGSVATHFRMFSEMAPPLKAAVASLAPDQVDRLRSAIADAVAPYTKDGCVKLPAAAILVSARA